MCRWAAQRAGLPHLCGSSAMARARGVGRSPEIVSSTSQLDSPLSRFQATWAGSGLASEQCGFPLVGVESNSGRCLSTKKNQVMCLRRILRIEKKNLRLRERWHACMTAELTAAGWFALPALDTWMSTLIANRFRSWVRAS